MSLDLPTDCNILKAGGSAAYEVAVGSNAPDTSYPVFALWGDAPFDNTTRDLCFAAAEVACDSTGDLQGIADCMRQKTAARVIATSHVSFVDTGNDFASAHSRYDVKFASIGGTIGFAALPAVGYDISTCGGKPGKTLGA